MERILGMFNSSKDKDRDQVSETEILLNKVLSELNVLKNSIERISASMQEGHSKLSDIERQLVEMAGNVTNSVTPAHLDTTFSQPITHIEEKVQPSTILMSPIKRSTGIELIKRGEDESFKAQFELKKSSGELSFNNDCLEFCMIDLEARLLPFVEADIAVKDQTPTKIEQIQTGIAENISGAWYCKVKPKLRIV